MELLPTENTSRLDGLVQERLRGSGHLGQATAPPGPSVFPSAKWGYGPGSPYGSIQFEHRGAGPAEESTSHLPQPWARTQPLEVLGRAKAVGKMSGEAGLESISAPLCVRGPHQA